MQAFEYIVIDPEEKEIVVETSLVLADDISQARDLAIKELALGETEIDLHTMQVVVRPFGGNTGR